MTVQSLVATYESHGMQKWLGNHDAAFWSLLKQGTLVYCLGDKLISWNFSTGRHFAWCKPCTLCDAILGEDNKNIVIAAMLNIIWFVFCLFWKWINVRKIGLKCNRVPFLTLTTVSSCNILMKIKYMCSTL